MGKAKKGAAAETKRTILVSCEFKDNRRKYKIDFLDLTFEEQVIVEELFNKPWEVLMQQGWVGFSAKGKVVLGYLARRRDDQDFTFEEALSKLKKVTAVAEGDEGGSPPTRASRSDGSRS
jgi:hypothetical protein